MTATWARRAAARAGVLTFVAATSLFLTTSPAGARSGSWGAAHSTYLDGVVCSTGTQTSPLASWDFGSGSPAFLTAPVVSDGVTDSAALPFASAGPQDVTPVLPGSLGFATPGDLATYAQLLARFGSGSSAQVAGVARAVMLHSTTDVPDCAGTGDATALLNQAATSAGPYTITVASTPRRAVPGEAATVTASVRGGSGGPAAGVPVTFASTGVTLPPTPVVTDAAGHARVRFTAPIDAGNAGPFDVTASVSAPVGLVQITTSAAPTGTDPGGATAVAIAPAAPTTVTAHASVEVDESAHPTIAAGFDAGAVAVGHPVIPHAIVHGLRGHTATVDLTVLGPLPLDPHGLCRAAAFTDSTPTVYTTDPLQTVGDATVPGTTWTPDRAGCYAARAGVTTVDATPEASAVSRPVDAVLTVISASLALTAPHPVVGAGVMIIRATAAHVGDAAHRLRGRLFGPVAPGAAGSCAEADWSHAARSGPLDITVAGTRPADLRSPRVTTPGCYRWTATLFVDLAGSSVPVAAVSPGTLLVRPSVSVTSDRTWTITPGAVATHVTVGGTYGLAAHVRVRLLYAARPDTGCRAASWAHATLSRPGPSHAAGAPGTAVAVASGRTATTGCYLPVVTLVLDANPAVTVTTTPSAIDNAVLAGVGRQERAALVTYRLAPASSSPLMVTAVIVGIVQLLVVVSIVVVARAWHVRDARD